MIQPKIIDPKTDGRWDDFVFTHPQGSIYHHSVWQEVLESTYGYTPFHIGLERADTGQLEAILPFFLVKSWLTGDRLVSLPMTAYCDRLIPTSELEKIVALALEHHPTIDFLELRFREDDESLNGMFAHQIAYITHILNLGRPLEQIWSSFHNTSVRQRIKRAERDGVTLRMGEREEDLQIFYKMETTVRKKHGLPPAPYSFFKNMWQSLGSRNFLHLPIVEQKGKALAAAIVLQFKDTVYFEYSASDPDSLKLCPNQKLIWETIKLAHKDGARYFDFGRSSVTNSSLVEFKERWGARRCGLSYYYFPKAKRANTEHGAARKIFEAVNRTLPCSLLQLEGKLIYPHLG